MPRAKRNLKVKRPGKVVSVAGIAGGAFLASSTSGSVADIPPQSMAPFQVLHLGEEEISDVSLATFHFVDGESRETALPRIQLARGGCGGGCGGCGGRGGCGGFRGCGGGFRGCGGCAGFRGCGRGCGFGGCGGCGWGWAWGLGWGCGWGGCCLSWEGARTANRGYLPIPSDTRRSREADLTRFGLATISYFQSCEGSARFRRAHGRRLGSQSLGRNSRFRKAGVPVR
jgi:hypothetical protein